MAITKSEKLNHIEIRPAGDSNDLVEPRNNDYPTIFISKDIILDDPSDDELPVINRKDYSLFKWQHPDSNGDVIETDYSGEDALVRSILDKIWN